MSELTRINKRNQNLWKALARKTKIVKKFMRRLRKLGLSDVQGWGLS